jgi:hypothetical protein
MKKLMINFVALCLLASVMITPGLAEHDELKPLPPVPHLLYTPEENHPCPWAMPWSSAQTAAGSTSEMARAWIAGP